MFKYFGRMSLIFYDQEFRVEEGELKAVDDELEDWALPYSESAAQHNGAQQFRLSCSASSTIISGRQRTVLRATLSKI